MRAITAQGELHIRFEEEVFVTQRSLFAENSVVRSGAECKIVSMNAARWRTRDVNLVKFFFEPAAVAGRKFLSGEQDRRDREVWLMLDRNRIFAFKFECASRRRGVMKRDRF